MEINGLFDKTFTKKKEKEADQKTPVAVFTCGTQF